MSSVQVSLYLIAVALCLFTTGLTTRAARGRPLTWFTGYLLLQSALFACELLMAHPATPLKAVWLALLMAGSLLVAPCLWLAFEETIGGQRASLRTQPRAHLWPILAGALLTLPLLSSAHVGTEFADPAHPSSWLYSKLIHTTMLLCIGIFAVQVPWYLARCRRILFERIGQRPRHWSQLPLVIVFTSWTLAIVRTVNCAFIKWPPQFSLIVAVISVSVTVGALYLLMREFSVAATPPREGERYVKSPLPAEVRERIRRKLEGALERDGLYKRSDLSLARLSGSLNESPHYVSQVISQDLGTSFYELVNRHRVNEARRRLRETPEDSVLSIAMDVGFNSKSAFHSAFRRVTGTTPSEFRSSPMGQDDQTRH